LKETRFEAFAMSKGKRKLKCKRKTPPPPVCPVHGVRMLVGHASRTRQYRYCTVAGCGESRRVDRVYRLKNASSLWLWGAIDAAGNVRLSPGFFR